MLLALITGIVFKLNDDLADMFHRPDLTPWTEKFEMFLVILLCASDFIVSFIFYFFNLVYSFLDPTHYESINTRSFLYFFPLIFLESYKTFEIPDFFNTSILVCWFLAGMMDIFTLDEEYSITKFLIRASTAINTGLFMWYFSDHISISVKKTMLMGLGYAATSAINQAIMLYKDYTTDKTKDAKVRD